jgi:hypothetical protein
MQVPVADAEQVAAPALDIAVTAAAPAAPAAAAAAPAAPAAPAPKGRVKRKPQVIEALLCIDVVDACDI